MLNVVMLNVKMKMIGVMMFVIVIRLVQLLIYGDHSYTKWI